MGSRIGRPRWVIGRMIEVMGKGRLAGLVVLLAVFGSGCRSNRPAVEAGTLRIETQGGTVTVRVEVADTEAARRTGLMNRPSVAAGGGMAFLFDQPTSAGFWMKDTLIPLDIAYWDRGGRIVAIRHMVPCRRDPCPLYSPGQPYTGAVEVNGGFLSAQGVRPGDLVRLSREAS
jgi:uncharacterized protein